MDTRTEHTPIPWRVGKDGHTIESDAAQIAILASYCSPELSARADAAFIVHAVNSYDQDQETIRLLTERLQESLNYMLNYNKCQNEGFLRDIRAALARAKQPKEGE